MTSSKSKLSTETKSLLGKRIVVTAIDLEQSEHRGIAAYSKSVIRNLKEAGAEVWLLTEYDEPMRQRGLRLLPKELQTTIYSSRVLDALLKGRQTETSNWIENRNFLIKRFFNFIRKLEKLIIFLSRPKYFPKHKLRHIHLKELFDNPYIRANRLDYMEYVEGLLCARKVFFSTYIAGLLKRQRPVCIDLKGFDALLTTCPLNIKPINTSIFVQTIHDLIPIEYSGTPDNALVFGHRLQACLNSRRLFVSKTTAKKFDSQVHKHINFHKRKLKENNNLDNQKVLTQPPSLYFPRWLTEDSKEAIDLRPVSYLLKAEKNNLLKPFKYFLFNSSVESRKNLLFLVKAYAESSLSSLGVRLCVTGKLKKDSYSKSVKEIIKHEPGILLTGYIDESTKLDLYLNSMGLLSPSLVEGFGIPVLDSACLGMHAIASDCNSHIEIKLMQDFNKFVLPVNTLESRDWALAMESIAGTCIHLSDDPCLERKNRIQRYQAKSRIINEQFKRGLSLLLN